MPGARADFTFFRGALTARDRYCACALSGRRDTAALHCTQCSAVQCSAAVSLHCTEESSSLLWVLRRWALTYLGTQENYCQEISQDLYAAFGRETEGAAWSVNFLLDKVLGNLAHCGVEPGVVEDTVLLLVGLAESREKCCAVLGSPGLQQLVAARPTRRRQARAVQGACAGAGGCRAGRGGAEGVLGSGEGQCSAVQCSAVYLVRCGARWRTWRADGWSRSSLPSSCVRCTCTHCTSTTLHCMINGPFYLLGPGLHRHGPHRGGLGCQGNEASRRPQMRRRRKRTTHCQND
jgi:hypothetical protein